MLLVAHILKALKAKDPGHTFFSRLQSVSFQKSVTLRSKRAYDAYEHANKRCCSVCLCVFVCVCCGAPKAKVAKGDHGQDMS